VSRAISHNNYAERSVKSAHGIVAAEPAQLRGKTYRTMSPPSEHRYALGGPGCIPRAAIAFGSTYVSSESRPRQRVKHTDACNGIKARERRGLNCPGWYGEIGASA
jgi:hypothetical protein